MRSSVRYFLCVFLLASGCAEGFDPQIVETTDTLSGAAGQAASPPVETPPTDPAGGAADPTTGRVSPADRCSQGTSESCTCDDGGEGMRRCMASSDSPTGGVFGDCGQCQAPADAGTGTGPSEMEAAAGTDCNTNTTVCSMVLQCCKPDGTCGAGFPGLCL